MIKVYLWEVFCYLVALICICIAAYCHGQLTEIKKRIKNSQDEEGFLEEDFLKEQEDPSWEIQKKLEEAFECIHQCRRSGTPTGPNLMLILGGEKDGK